jgi:citrate lyase subunit beta/citryl-CoA lyase
VVALCFGHADFALDLGVSAADPSTGILYHARCSLVLAAKGAAVAPIDTVCLGVRDAEAFRRDALQALALGFEGKLCIHPAQVSIANEVFAPTREQIEHALRVVEAAAAARRDGRGVFSFEGQMIDSPLVERCERLLARARRAGSLGP